MNTLLSPSLLSLQELFGSAIEQIQLIIRRISTSSDNVKIGIFFLGISVLTLLLTRAKGGDD